MSEGIGAFQIGISAIGVAEAAPTPPSFGFPLVQGQLNDLPTTFLRPTVDFLQWQDSLAAGLTRSTGGAVGTSAQLTFSSAQYGWLDTWGLLLGFPRNPNEADSVYYGRISFSLAPGTGSPNAIASYIQLVYGLAVVLVETFAPGYTITFSAQVTLAQITQVVANLARVRPAGVPFQLFTQNTGPYLDTINYLNAPRIAGAYLNGGARQVYPIIPSGTNNSPPLIPTLLLTDPTLNS